MKKLLFNKYRKGLILLLSILITNQGFGQTKALWAKQFDYPTYENPIGRFQKDESGNIYLFKSNSSKFYYTNEDGFIIAKFDSVGNEKWRINVLSKASITSLKYFNNNLYVSGNYKDTLILGNKKLTSKGYKDVFITQLNCDGNVNWLSSLGGKGSDEAGGLAISKKSMLIVIGSVRENPEFGNNFRTLKFSQDNRSRPFIASYFLNGNVNEVNLWQTELYETKDTSYSNVKAFEPIINQKGEIFFIWKLCDIEIKEHNLSIYGEPHGNDYCFNLIKLNEDLTFNKHFYLGSDNEDDFFDLKIDPKDNIYLLNRNWNHYYGSWTRLLKFNSSLNNYSKISIPLLAPEKFYFSNSFIFNGIDFDEKGNVITAGYSFCDDYKGGVYTFYQLCKFDSLARTIENKGYSIKKWLSNFDLIIDNNKTSFYTIGETNDTFKVDSNTITSSNLFLIKFNSKFCEDCDNTGISQFSLLNNSLEIYPNPSNGSFNVLLSGVEAQKAGLQEIRVFNVMGQLIFTESFGTKQKDSFTPSELGMTATIDLSDKPKGIYFVEVVSTLRQDFDRLNLTDQGSVQGIPRVQKIVLQ